MLADENALDGVEEQPDGSAVIDLGGTLPEGEEEQTPHDANLAGILDEVKLNAIATDLLEKIERDKEAREERDKQQEEGIRRTGLGNDAPGGAEFDGASNVVHPILAEGCVDFSARAIKELFPANGPVKTKIYGITDEKKLEKAKRKRDYLNYYTTVKMPEYRAEKEVLLTQLPLGGSQYEKYWYDTVKKRACMQFVPVDKVLLPYAANSFYDSPRITHLQEYSKAEIEDYVESEFYRDVFSVTEQQIQQTASQEATNKVEGKTETGYNEDGVRQIFEITCLYNVEGEVQPYVIHIDESTRRICGLYRNWSETDATPEPLQWWVEDKFIPWRGAYGIGLPHLIGGMAASLTGALRALLDSAHINNAPSAIKLKGGRTSGQNVNVDLTSVTEIEAPAGVDDIRKLMMPLPFNPPSAVLFQLLDWLSAQAKGVVATAEEKIADAGNNMPVGTTLALIEQGSQVFSSIHARLHESQRRALKIICRLIAMYPDAEDLQKFGLMPEDFLESDDIEPVSDPHIFSESQRFAQMQSVMQLAAGDAQDPSIQWNKIALRRRMLDLLRVDGVDELLPKPPQPITADPVTENVAAMQGAMLKTAPVQDHMAHIQTHLLFILHPLMAEGPGMNGPVLARLMDHIQEHIVVSYQQMVELMKPQIIAMAQQRQIPLSPDQIAMHCAMIAQDSTAQLAAKLLPELQKAAELVKAKSPPPPMDPAIKATYEVGMAEVNRKAKHDDEDIKLRRDEQQAKYEQSQASVLDAMEARQQKFEQDLNMFVESLEQQYAELEAKREADTGKLLIEILKLGQASAQLNADADRKLQEDIQQQDAGAQ